MRHRALALTLTLALALAGCAKDEVERQEQEIAPGTLQGVVTDVALLPIEGATVSVEGTNHSAVTDATGAWSFEILPGEYVVLAQRDEYKTGALRASVHSAQSSILAFQLEAIPRIVPYHEVQEAEGYLACTVLVAQGEQTTATPCGENDPNQSPSVQFAVSTLQGLEGVLVEIAWEARSQGAGTMRVEAAARADDGLVSLGSAEGASPLPLRIAGRLVSGDAIVVTLAPAGSFTDDEAGVDAGVVLQQPFTAYATFFYHADAPAGYSAISSTDAR